MKKLVQFGAGNIGRSFLGQLFSRSGYEVVFVDIDDRLVDALNAQRSYRVIVKHGNRPDETLWIRNVRALHGNDADAVAEELSHASIASTAVGQSALSSVLPLIARGLELRHTRNGDRPLDIVIAENLHSAADYFRTELRLLLPPDYPFDKLVGLVESSIGKMVPIMREADLEQDPLWVFAEPYNTLILDRRGFKNPIPLVDGLAPMDNMAAYVDRKLFIHNLGHAAAAYLGHRYNPKLTTIHEVLDIPSLNERIKRAMMQSAAVLCRAYPDDFTLHKLEAHVNDLLARFRNWALGDTIYRVGRDLPRKLARNDRLVGALLLGQKYDLPTDLIARVYLAALHFRACNEKGNLFPADKTFVEEDFPQGLDHILTHISGLSPEDPAHRAVIDQIKSLA